MKHFAILTADFEVIPTNDFSCWVRWFEKSNRTIEKYEHGGVIVSTVFLGINHAFGAHEDGVWFETMIFGGEHDQSCRRYNTIEEARAGHLEMVNLVK
jgi:hypothetical protein